MSTIIEDNQYETTHELQNSTLIFNWYISEEQPEIISWSLVAFFDNIEHDVTSSLESMSTYYEQKCLEIAGNLISNNDLPNPWSNDEN